jgi:hypothetical protein
MQHCDVDNYFKCRYEVSPFLQLQLTCNLLLKYVRKLIFGEYRVLLNV